MEVSSVALHGGASCHGDRLRVQAIVDDGGAFIEEMFQALLTWFATLPQRLDVLDPTATTPTTMARKIIARMRLYSTAVAPRSSFETSDRCRI